MTKLSEQIRERFEGAKRAIETSGNAYNSEDVLIASTIMVIRDNIESHGFDDATADMLMREAE